MIAQRVRLALLVSFAIVLATFAAATAHAGTLVRTVAANGRLTYLARPHGPQQVTLTVDGHRVRGTWIAGCEGYYVERSRFVGVVNACGGRLLVTYRNLSGHAQRVRVTWVPEAFGR